ncbi:MAG: hypothetical protein WCJ30_02675 [Deltaproteobacteria bacterium]
MLEESVLARGIAGAQSLEKRKHRGRVLTLGKERMQIRLSGGVGTWTLRVEGVADHRDRLARVYVHGAQQDPATVAARLRTVSVQKRVRALGNCLVRPDVDSLDIAVREVGEERVESEEEHAREPYTLAGRPTSTSGTSRAKMIAVVKAVADAPPPSWSGGGYWEAMHGDMTGYCEVRVDEGRRFHHQLFCLLERDGNHPSLGLGAPSLILLDGRTKEFKTLLTGREYKTVLALGDEYKARKPRSVLR